MIVPRSNMPVIDVETTGLIAHQGFLLEIACIVVDADLNILDDEGYQAVVSYDELEVVILRDEADRRVREMHDKTGLWDRLTSEDAKPLHQIDQELSEYLARFGEPRTMPLVGNSPRLDFNFIDEHLPITSMFLDYHMRDVSTIAGAAEDWYGQTNFVKGNDHTAMTDVRECIKEFRHYRDTVFKRRFTEQFLDEIISGKGEGGLEVGHAWGEFYRPGMTDYEARAFKAGYRAGLVSGNGVES